MEVEFPTNSAVNLPAQDGSPKEPKQNVKFTINMPNMAYALAMSKPRIRWSITVFVYLTTTIFWLSENSAFAMHSV